MKMLLTFSAALLAAVLFTGPGPALHADGHKADPEKVSALIAKIRQHREAKEKKRAEERKKREERRRQRDRR
jgi:hypothetical protein